VTFNLPPGHGRAWPLELELSGQVSAPHLDFGYSKPAMERIEYISGTTESLPIRLRLFGRNLGECCWLRRIADVGSSLDAIYNISGRGSSFSAHPRALPHLDGEPWLKQYGKLSLGQLESLQGEINPDFCKNASHPICVHDDVTPTPFSSRTVEEIR